MSKRFVTFFILCLIFLSSMGYSQLRHISDIDPFLPDREIKPDYPIIEAIWDVQFNYDAVAVTGLAGNAGAVYIPTINKYWTSRWASAIAHQWNADGTLDLEFTLPFVGTRGMCFDGQYVYHSINTTTVEKVDPVTRAVVGTVSVAGAPNGARFITYNPDADGGAGGIIVGNWIAPNLNFYEYSLTGTLLRTITNTVTGVYGLAYDNYSPGGPFLWVWSQGAGAGTPQNIQQMDYTSGVYTGVQHDVALDIAPGIAGGLFIVPDLIPGFVTLGGMLQGNPGPDRLFGYELTTTGALPCPVQPATNPSPADGTTGVSINTPGDITWTNGANTTQVEVFFGPEGNVVSVYSGAPITSLPIPNTPLQYATTYQWRVVCKNDTCSGTPVATWSFITEQDPELFCWTDDFTAGTGNWTITDDGGTPTCLWAIHQASEYTLPVTAVGNVLAADVDACGTGSTLLSTATITAPFDFSMYMNAYIEFDNDWQALNALDFGYVEVSTDGTNWTAVRTFDITDVRNTHEVVDITAIAAMQPTVYVRLRSVQPDWDWWWAVDNFTVCASGVTPVELKSFNASVNVNNVNLNWSTATELNNSGFQIERSNGSEYQVVGFVAGHGTTTDVQNYTFSDQNVESGKYTYRLKQVDFNGTFEYSNTIEVEVIGVKEFKLGQNYPNPFNPSTTINFSLAVDSKVSLKIFDVLGQEVATLVNGQLAAGSQKVSFNASSLNSGVYFYRIDADGIDGQKFSSVKKMILTK